MTDETVLTPLKGYNDVYKELHHKNVVDYFNDLVKKSNVDINANKATVKKYNETLSILSTLKKSLSKYKFLRGLLIFTLIFIIILSIVLIAKAFVYNSVHFAVGIVMILVLICSIVGFAFLNKNLKAKIHELNSNIYDKDKVANKLLDDAYAQMFNLNISFDYGISSSLVNKTVPLIEMDKILDNKKLEQLKSFGLRENIFKNRSTCFVQSGSILGNPFALITDHVQYWIDKVYTGSLTIHWTTVEKTKDGYVTRHHTQVLTASIVKPCPRYSYDTKFYFGSDAAPDLTFSRHSTHASSMSEKEKEKYINKESKKLEKKTEKAIKSGQNFTKISNDEFEVLFKATDRDNEVQFRLMYTPLAQQNIVNLLSNQNPYGDDFSQYKEKKLNIIHSTHSQLFDYEDKPNRYIDYDYEQIRNKFITYNDNYFKSFYFDIAPLLSVPLYQQTKAHSFIYPDSYDSNVTSFEQECMANRIGENYFKPKESTTDSILKTKHFNKIDNFDNVSVTAYSFHGIDRVALIPRMGGDGHMHAVPVPWVEYFPVESTGFMNVTEKECTRQGYTSLSSNDSFNSLIKTLSNRYTYKNGLFATAGKYFVEEDVRKVNQAFNEVKDDLKKKVVFTASTILAATMMKVVESKKEEKEDKKEDKEE